MPQVVSKNLAKTGDTISPNGLQPSSTWKNPLMIAFHGAAASTYGYAICWQTVSESSRQLYLRSNPLVRVYAHFVPRLRRSRDFVFTSLALPIGILVVTTFWGVWFTLGREFIFPVEMEQHYPSWLNHVTHTIIAPINLIELLTSKKQYPTNKKAITTLAGYTFAYTSYLLYIKWQTGRFVYPFLDHLSPTGTGIFIAGTMFMVVAIYKLGKVVHDAVHQIKPVKFKLSESGKKNH